MRDYKTVQTAIAASTKRAESLKITNELLLDIRELLTQQQKPLQENDINEMSVFELPVSGLTKTGFQYNKIRQLGELRNLSAYELLQMRHFGKTSVKKLITVLKDYGIHLSEH